VWDSGESGEDGVHAFGVFFLMNENAINFGVLKFRNFRPTKKICKVCKQEHAHCQ
jgi:hypothetical protein